jgi:SPP1 family predicted phage head-tail adaptor
MDRSEIITLLNESKTQDENGVWHKTLTEKQVFCQVDSVTRSEFFEAGRNGLNPEYRFTIFFGDYDGQREVRYKGKTYAVYRTYHARTDVLELYAERKGGTNGD